PVGVAHIKDVMKILAPEADRAAPNWAEPVLHRIRRELHYVPASMRAADLLLKMQASRIHMALVIDEFGGTDGLVTLEDLIEAVVGDIDDEYDEVTEAALLERPNGVLEADGRLPLEDLEAKLSMSLVPSASEEDIGTLAGLVVVIAGRVPQRGEVVPHPDVAYDFEVLDGDPRRIKRIRIRQRPMAVAAPSVMAKTS
ncbi:MAG: transporter associated domain-containing protein, partial [Asticcacaulis sp.]